MKIPQSIQRKATHRQEGPNRSALEAKFLRMWESLGGPVLSEQYKFHPTRDWRFDFAFLEHRNHCLNDDLPQLLVGIELQGGTWTRGRHARGKGYAGDAEKYRAAARLGWLIWPMTTDDVTRENLMELIEFCRCG